MSRTREFTTKIKRLLYSIKQIFFEKKEEPKPITSLAARVLKSKEEIEKIQPYLNRLNSALTSKDVTNIALTGTYGSGKSTVIKTFQDIHKAEDPNNDFRYLNISLASFKDEIIENEENGTRKAQRQKGNEDFERLIEVSILQQMIYHVKPSRIPDSRFKRIVNLASKKLIVPAIGFVLWLISAFCIWEFGIFEKFNPLTWTFSFKDFDLVSFLVIVIFLGGLVNFVIRLIRIFGNSRISKINIKGELELGENVDKSILNQHLDEIIYFFQKTEFNVVVIEDLDRFRDTEIFTKLREINLLLNNSELIKRKIVFVYAIRDDMFQGHERIKFFDYIIPVIPFINPSNANDKLAELLKEANISEDFTPSFIDTVVTFIDDIDMRLLTNILQEYLVYKESLKHELKQDNLLAIVIYKNIYPRDFAKLHKNEGDLFDFIANKESYIKKTISTLDEEIAYNDSMILELEKEKIKDEKELREIYLYNLLSQLDNPVEVLIEGRLVDIDKLSEDNNFFDLRDEKKINYYYLRSNNNSAFYRAQGTLNKSFSNIEKQVNSSHTYSERLELINSNNDNKIQELKESNENLSERKVEIRGWDLKQIFQNQDVGKYLEAFEDSILMRSLLVNGYINENYLDYISLFHEVNITKSDYTFIRKVKSNENLEFNFNIEKLENVIKRIDENHFEKVAILNHQVVEFILKNKLLYRSRYRSLRRLLRSENKKVIDFIDSYKKSEHTDNSVLFKDLPRIWVGIWNFIATKSKYSEKKTNEYFQLIITHAAISDIERLTNIKSFKQHFSTLSNLGQMVSDKNQSEKLKSIITNFKTRFNDISELNYKNEYLYDHVLSNDHYEINTANLLAISKNESINEEVFNASNYTVLRNLENKSTSEYIERNIEIYVTKVFLNLDNTQESEDSMVLLLNNDDLTIPTKRQILESITITFQDLSVFNDIEIKEDILLQFAITINWKNVMHYFNTYTKENLDSILTHYLNNEEVYNELSKSNLSSLNDDDETKKKLALAVIECNDLSLESHKKIRACYHSAWTGLSISDLSYDKVEAMIEANFIKLSVHYYDEAKSNFSDLHIKLIEKSFKKYIEAHGDYTMDKEDHLNMLESPVLLSAQKKQFLDILSEYQIVENTTIANSATKVYVNERVSTLSYSLLHELFVKGSSDVKKIQLFNLNVRLIDKTRAEDLIGYLGLPYKNLTKPRKRENVNNNEINKEFSDTLRELGVLTSNREDKRNRGMLKLVASS